MPNGETGTRFAFGRDRVSAKKFSEDWTLLFYGGTLRQVDYNEKLKIVTFRCDNGDIVLKNSDFAMLEARQDSSIAIRCINSWITIEGDNSDIELNTIVDLIHTNFVNKQKKVEEAVRPPITENHIDGYYFILGVSIDATHDQIKKAYRIRSLEVHPDVNKDLDAHEKFLRLQQAYEILSNSQKRSEYDAQFIDIPGLNRSTSKNEKGYSIDPIRCSVCNSVTAQPRYVVFWETVSFFKTIRSPVQGIMCVKCAGNAALDATRKSLILGWWGIWGLVLTPISIMTNLMGGERPSENNGRILLHQSWYFAQNNRPDIAYFLASDSMSYLKILTTQDKSELVALCGQIIKSCAPFAEGKEMEKIWDKKIPMFNKQLKAIGVFTGIAAIGIGIFSIYLEKEYKRSVEGAPQYSYTNQETPPSNNSSESLLPKEPPQPPPIPSIYLPLETGYLPVKEIKNQDGYSELTLNNNTESNFHVKLYFWRDGVWTIGREVYLKKNEIFTMKDMSPGKYEIRRLDVQTKNATKSKPYIFEEIKESNGIKYSTMTLTFSVYRGNSRIIPITAKEF